LVHTPVLDIRRQPVKFSFLSRWRDAAGVNDEATPVIQIALSIKGPAEGVVTISDLQLGRSNTTGLAHEETVTGVAGWSGMSRFLPSPGDTKS
jgi:hypothetical protein